MSLRESVSEAVCSKCYEKANDCIRLKKYEWCKKPGYWNYAMTNAILAAVAEWGDEWCREHEEKLYGHEVYKRHECPDCWEQLRKED